MDTEQLIREIEFKAARSSGAGGQHVNKVATKVVLIFDLAHSKALTEEQKTILYSRLASRISKDGRIVVQADDTRSQTKNRRIAESRMIRLLTDALKEVPERKKTKPTRASREKRLQAKRRISAKKQSRRPPETE